MQVNILFNLYNYYRGLTTKEKFGKRQENISSNTENVPVVDYCNKS